MGWLIALAVIVLLLMLPLGASVIYNSDGVKLSILAGPVRIRILPAKKKDKPKKEKSKKEKKKTQKKTKKKKTDDLPEPEKPKEKGGPITDFLPLVEVALDCLGAFPRTLRLNVLEVKVILAGGDPCDLATNYGKIWAAIGNLWPRLEEIFIIKKRDINLECDFTADQTLVIARLDLTLTLGRIFSWLIRYGVRALKVFLKIQKTRKGGAAT